MRTLRDLKNYAIVILTMVVITACGPGFIDPVPGSPTPPATPTLSPSLTAISTFGPEFIDIDQALRASLPATIAYNVPQSMRLNDTASLELLLNPSVAPSELEAQITQDGEVITANIQITPRMRAVLIAQEADTFVIRSMHASDEQLVSPTQTTKWSWDVTAKKGGIHRLTLQIHRFISVNGAEEWRLVEAYRRDIEVQVTMAQRLLMLDWKWIVGILVTALLVPAFWRWADQRRKQSEPTPMPKSHKRKAR